MGRRDNAEVYRRRGEIDLYVYHLVQGRRDLAERAKPVESNTVKLGLTAEQRTGLDRRLAELDGRRVRPRQPSVRLPAPAWHGEQPTARQLAYLQEAGYRGPAPATKGEAMRLILRHKRLLRRWQEACDEGLPNLETDECHPG